VGLFQELALAVVACQDLVVAPGWQDRLAVYAEIAFLDHVAPRVVPGGFQVVSFQPQERTAIRRQVRDQDVASLVVLADELAQVARSVGTQAASCTTLLERPKVVRLIAQPCLLFAGRPLGPSIKTSVLFPCGS